MVLSLKAPAQILVFKCRGRRAIRRAFNRPLDLSRDSLCTSRANALRWGARLRATRLQRYYGLAAVE